MNIAQMTENAETQIDFLSTSNLGEFVVSHEIAFGELNVE